MELKNSSVDLKIEKYSVYPDLKNKKFKENLLFSSNKDNINNRLIEVNNKNIFKEQANEISNAHFFTHSNIYQNVNFEKDENYSNLTRPKSTPKFKSPIYSTKFLRTTKESNEFLLINSDTKTESLDIYYRTNQSIYQPYKRNRMYSEKKFKHIHDLNSNSRQNIQNLKCTYQHSDPGKVNLSDTICITLKRHWMKKHFCLKRNLKNNINIGIKSELNNSKEIKELKDLKEYKHSFNLRNFDLIIKPISVVTDKAKFEMNHHQFTIDQKNRVSKTTFCDFKIENNTINIIQCNRISEEAKSCSPIIISNINEMPENNIENHDNLLHVVKSVKLNQNCKNGLPNIPGDKFEELIYNSIKDSVEKIKYKDIKILLNSSNHSDSFEPIPICKMDKSTTSSCIYNGMNKRVFNKSEKINTNKSLINNSNAKFNLTDNYEDDKQIYFNGSNVPESLRLSNKTIINDQENISKSKNKLKQENKCLRKTPKLTTLFEKPIGHSNKYINGENFIEAENLKKEIDNKNSFEVENIIKENNNDNENNRYKIRYNANIEKLKENFKYLEIDKEGNYNLKVKDKYEKKLENSNNKKNFTEYFPNKTQIKSISQLEFVDSKSVRSNKLNKIKHNDLHLINDSNHNKFQNIQQEKNNFNECNMLSKSIDPFKNKFDFRKQSIQKDTLNSTLRLKEYYTNYISHLNLKAKYKFKSHLDVNIENFNLGIKDSVGKLNEYLMQYNIMNNICDINCNACKDFRSKLKKNKIDNDNKIKLFFNLDEMKEKLITSQYNFSNNINFRKSGQKNTLSEPKIKIFNDHCQIYPINDVDYNQTKYRSKLCEKLYSHLNIKK